MLYPAAFSTLPTSAHNAHTPTIKRPQSETGKKTVKPNQEKKKVTYHKRILKVVTVEGALF